DHLAVALRRLAQGPRATAGQIIASGSRNRGDITGSQDGSVSRSIRGPEVPLGLPGELRRHVQPVPGRVREPGPQPRRRPVGAGVPRLVSPGGGLNSSIAALASPFNPLERYRDDFRCVAADLRNANPGQSSGPLEVDRPWDAHADDQLGLMDHLGIDRFLVMGFCIGGPMILNLIRRAPDRVVAAAMMQPSGFRPEMPDLFYR